MVLWFIFDLDYLNLFIWEDEGFFVLNIVVSNCKNGYVYLFYVIVSVCMIENVCFKFIKYMKVVYEVMFVCLNVDLVYSGFVVKMLGYFWWLIWEIYGSEYELGELVDYVDLVVNFLWRISGGI